MSAPTIVISVSSNGTVLDSIPLPTSSLAVARLEAVSVTETGTSRATTIVPFTPQASWAVHRNGSIVLAFSDGYRVDLKASSGAFLRIGRDFDPVPVLTREREFHEAQVTAGMRQTDPNWRWTGTAIPSHKPPFRSVFVGKDGKLWLWLRNPGIEEPNPDYDPATGEQASTMWNEAVSFDVFEPDGRYLGRVDAPPEFTTSPMPIFDADGVWSVTRDDLDVQRVVRFALRIISVAP
jgi:hypothetical protein